MPETCHARYWAFASFRIQILLTRASDIAACLQLDSRFRVECLGFNYGTEKGMRERKLLAYGVYKVAEGIMPLFPAGH